MSSNNMFLAILEAATESEEPSAIVLRRANLAAHLARWSCICAIIAGYAKVLASYGPGLVEGTASAPGSAVSILLGTTALVLPLLGVAATVVPALAHSWVLGRKPRASRH